VAQNGIDRLTRSILRIRPEVRVRVDRLRRARMTEARLNDLHALAVPDEKRCVEVPEVVELKRPGSDGGSGYWIPTVSLVVASAA
jgi:hypothetical protein